MKQRLSLVSTTPRTDSAPGQAAMHRMPMLVRAATPLVPKSAPPRDTSWRDLLKRLSKTLGR
ncbi:MAG TPA: hypothetical protein VNU64_21020 [Burkholderiales bacterium]|nr:hypothetical protein [Burkholderiales bacterium]